MHTIKIGKDPFQKKDIIKVIFDKKPKTQLFSPEDVIIGHPSSNLTIAIVYTWKEDRAPLKISDFMQKLSNYAYLTGYWRTTNGARYVFANILANPNVNKLFVLVFEKEDNGHLLVNALENFWKNGVDKQGLIINCKAQNPKFEQVSNEGLQRIRKQADLVTIRNIKNFEQVQKLIQKSVNEPHNAVQLKEHPNIKFISNVIDKDIIYDDGARFEKPFDLNLTKSAKTVIYKQKDFTKALGKGVQADNLNDALQNIAAYIFENGSVIMDVRGIKNLECRSFSITIKDPLQVIPEGFSKNYILDYVDELINGPKNESMRYNYHDRIFKRWGNQVERAIKAIKKSMHTRRAVISLWDPKTDLESTCPPCFNSIWVAAREKLEFHVIFRSHHLATVTENGKLMPGEGGFVPNIYAIATLQEKMAKRLNIPRGPLVLTDMSGHLYVSKVGGN